MSFDAFIESAWADHADDAEGVARRLSTSLDIIGKPADIPPFANLAAHVYGEHLARWNDGVALLASLRQSPHWDASDDLATVIARTTAALRYGAGEASALDALTPSERVSALCTAASALGAQQQWGRAIVALDDALAIGRGATLDARATRSLAVAGNNTAAALEEKADRSPGETAAMLTAAHAGLTFWKLAGGWLEEERAEHRLARSLMAAGDFDAALDHARRCIAVCVTHDASPFERFHAHAALALAARGIGNAADFDAARDRARASYAQMADEAKPWCAAELAALDRA